MGKFWENCLYVVARFHNAQSLKEFLLDFIVKKYAVLQKTKAWKQLEEDALTEINIWKTV